jgi:SAM-dependent methyltransferase
MHPDQELFTQQEDGVFVPRTPVEHREAEYDPAGFDILADMQLRHFWYKGRHRFLLHALRGVVRRFVARRGGLPAMIDLGGGCGGWVQYLAAHPPPVCSELALGDSSARCLSLAGRFLGPEIRRYQVDLLRTAWEDRWDVIFLLDVLEHIPADVEAMRQVWKALRPGGYLFVTAPALRLFWTYNDRLVHHVRRYSRGDLLRLAGASGLRLSWSRYFMFFLSPLLILSRLKSPNLDAMTQEETVAYLTRTHRVPPKALNTILGAIFSLETPLGAWLAFPWGTSVLGVFQKEAN